MKRYLLASIAGLLLGGSAHAAPSYAVLSLVGDKLDVVTYQMATGSKLDANSHNALALPQDEFDLAALRAINRTLKTKVPGAQVALLAASRAEDFADQDRIFDGGRVALPAEIDAAVQREGAANLLLVTKHHGEARMRVMQGRIGSGRVEGLGFYLDGTTELEDHDTGKRAVGFIAPFVYVDVSLVDVATRSVVRRKTSIDVSVGRAVGRRQGLHAHVDARRGTRRRGAGPGRARRALIRGRPDQPLSAWACLSIVSASLTSNLPGASTLSVLTTPSTTSIE